MLESAMSHFKFKHKRIILFTHSAPIKINLPLTLVVEEKKNVVVLKKKDAWLNCVSFFLRPLCDDKDDIRFHSSIIL